MDRPALQLSDDEWRKRLTPAEYHVLRQAGTERPFIGEYTDTKTPGVYECRACGAELFRSAEKFESHCGWPSFFDPAGSDAVILRSDDSLGMRRVEVVCAGNDQTYFLNGVQVNAARDASLSEGRILIQSEGAELFVRRIELQPLGAR